MNDLDPLANLDLFLWFLPLGLAMGLAVTSFYRAFATRGAARNYALAAAISLGTLVVSLVFLSVGYVLLAILALLGLGAWIAAVVTAPAWLLWTEAIILPMGLFGIWLFL